MLWLIGRFVNNPSNNAVSNPHWYSLLQRSQPFRPHARIYPNFQAQLPTDSNLAPQGLPTQSGLGEGHGGGNRGSIPLGATC